MASASPKMTPAPDFLVKLKLFLKNVWRNKLYEWIEEVNAVKLVFLAPPA